MTVSSQTLAGSSLPAPLVQRSVTSSGLSLDDLSCERNLAFVSLHRGQPAVHREDGIVGEGRVADQRDRTAPQHLVGRGAELALEASPHRVRAVDVMKRARIWAAQVDDRDLVEVVGRVDRAGAIEPLERDRVGRRALLGDVQIEVATADMGVEVDELRR